MLSDRSLEVACVAKALAFAAAVMVTLLFVLVYAKPAHAVTLTVNSTADTGDATPEGTCSTCTLREAIQEATFVSGADTINFNIPDGPAPGLEVKTISPASALPTITGAVTINGYTQAGAVANTATTNANSAVLKVELSGRRPNGSRLAASGLTIQASPCVVKGLAINRFGQHGVLIKSASNTVEGNCIGIDPGGTIDRGNGGDGVRIGNAGNTIIGGTSAGARNIISGNNKNGVFISGTNSATFNRIEGNYIGTDASGTGALGNNVGNAEVGVRVETPGNFIGGTATGAGNVISDNGGTGVSILDTAASNVTNNEIEGNLIGPDANGDPTVGGNFHGVFISGAPGNVVGGTVAEAANTISGNRNHAVMILGDAATGNSVLRDSIFGNGSPGGLGIALNNDGVTANENKDPDTGPN
jgi:CSLREA domain-containing protein